MRVSIEVQKDRLIARFRAFPEWLGGPCKAGSKVRNGGPATKREFDGPGQTQYQSEGNCPAFVNSAIPGSPALFFWCLQTVAVFAAVSSPPVFSVVYRTTPTHHPSHHDRRRTQNRHSSARQVATVVAVRAPATRSGSSRSWQEGCRPRHRRRSIVSRTSTMVPLSVAGHRWNNLHFWPQPPQPGSLGVGRRRRIPARPGEAPGAIRVTGRGGERAWFASTRSQGPASRIAHSGGWCCYTIVSSTNQRGTERALRFVAG
jgi:hypothetical protein